MDTVNISDAKSRLSKLIDKAAAGKDVVICLYGKPLVRITRLAEPLRGIKFGVLAGQVRVASDFDAPMPVDVLAAFDGR